MFYILLGKDMEIIHKKQSKPAEKIYAGLLLL